MQPTASTRSARWCQVDLGDSSRRNVWISEAQILWDALDNPHFAQHPGRLHTDHGSVVIVEQRRGGTLLAYVVLTPRRDALSVRVGSFAVPGINVLQAEVIGGIVGMPDKSESGWAAIADALPEALSGAVIGLRFLPPVEVESDTRLRDRFRVFRLGRYQAHYACDLPSSYQGYLATLAPRYRQHLRRVTRNLEKKFGDTVQFREYSRLDEVASFLEDAVPISAATALSRLLKIGISEHYLERKVQYEELAARNAWFGYILFCNETPVAFSVGCSLGSVFYGMEMGYRPEWAPYAIGRVVFAKLIERLLARDAPPARLDFFYGDHEWKRGFANRSWEEGSYLLVPRRSPVLPIIVAAVAGERLTATVAAQLARWGLKERVRNLMQRMVAR